MRRINSILLTSLFTDYSFRQRLVKLLETSCGFSFKEDRTYHSYFDDENFTLSKPVLGALSDSPDYIGFDIDERDKIQQTMIFVFLFYSLAEFPNIESWKVFLNETEDIKIERVKKGITKTWIEFQETMIIERLETDKVDEEDLLW